jgi:hypothetical protein
MTGELDIFQNPGGNSWLDDDHYFLCEISSYYGDWTDGFQTIADIAGQIGITEEELKLEVLDFLNAGLEPDNQWEIDDVEYSDVVDYMENSGKYMDKIYEETESIIRSDRGAYYDRAVDIIDRFDEDLEEQRREASYRW